MAENSNDDALSSVARSKVLHVILPEATYWHLQQCAIESRLSLKAYVIELSRSAKPLEFETLNLNQEANDEPGTSTRSAA